LQDVTQAKRGRSTGAAPRCDHRGQSKEHAMPPFHCPRAVAVLLALSVALPALAQQDPPRRLERLRALKAQGLAVGADTDTASRAAPAGTRVVRDVAYGPDPAQRFDVYVPATLAASHAPLPVIFFVHGGAWAFGDKTNSQVVEPKVAHWIAQGYLVISADYRMLPTPVAQQADDVAAAIAFAQSHAASWGGDPKRFILMGHSAGAHLVALISAGARTASTPQPWRGSVLLDSAALDVPALMNERHLGLYDRAFGDDPRQWTAVSPMAQLAPGTPPMLAVCSSRRRESCGRADRFAAKATGLGGQARVLREDLSHMQINATLGAASDYTAQVDAFLQSVR
jgi:arylformamidase